MRVLDLAVMIVLSVSPACAASGTDVPAPPSITVEGEAIISVVPDTALMSLGVVTERPKADEAATENAKAVQAVLDAVKAEGIAAEAVQTAAVGLSALYDAGSKGAPKINGFRASNSLQIRIKPADKAGALAGKLIDKGVNSIDGIEFVSSPDAKRRDGLRADAMRDARHRAEIYVEAAGLKLGRVLAIVPSDSLGQPEPRLFRHMASPKIAAAAPLPLAAGSQDERAAVSVTFEIVQ